MATNQNCFLISVIGARDGVGKTVFATNIAISFQRETRRRVCLVDLDPVYCGDILSLLQINSAKTISELAPVVDKAQPALLKGFVTPHSSGVHVLPLYKDARELAQVSPDAAARTLELLSELYDFLIIDVGTVVNDLSIKALERSTAVFIIATPDVMVLQQSRRLVEQLQSLHFPKEMLKVILNRFEPKGAIPLEVVIQKLQRQILTAVVRDDQVVTQSVNMGQPFVISQPRAQITKNFDDLARTSSSGESSPTSGRWRSPRTSSSARPLHPSSPGGRQSSNPPPLPPGTGSRGASGWPRSIRAPPSSSGSTSASSRCWT